MCPDSSVSHQNFEAALVMPAWIIQWSGYKAKWVHRHDFFLKGAFMSQLVLLALRFHGHRLAGPRDTRLRVAIDVASVLGLPSQRPIRADLSCASTSESRIRLPSPVLRRCTQVGQL
eukprot:scaffold2269_cov221-Pinguiococcus_pyrenoidosus.AAC.12